MQICFTNSSDEQRRAKRREYTRRHRAKMREIDRGLRVTMAQVYEKCGIELPADANKKGSQ